MQFNPVLAGMHAYPYLALDQAKQHALEKGLEIIDFGEGDPRERTDPRIRQALIDHIPEISSYPKAAGLPPLRRAIAEWCRRRFDVDVDPDHETLPTLGSKETIFHLPLALVDARGPRNIVVCPNPGYPVYERGALFAGAEVLRLPLLEENGFLPDLDAIPASTWERVALFWVNYPNNPTGACAPLSFYERLSRLAIEHDFVLASDEAYGEIYFGAPPVSALQVRDRRNVAIVNTLSKRSSMTGYRSGSLVAAAELISALKLFRPMVGVAPQEFVQMAGAYAWGDESHVEQMRAGYAAKREIFIDLFARKGLRVVASEASFYLWLAVPAGHTSESFAASLLEGGIVLAPGTFFGSAGEGYVRLALVPTVDKCRRAAAILEAML